MRVNYEVKYEDKQYEVEFNEPAGTLLSIVRIDVQNRPSGSTKMRRTLMSSLWTPREISRAFDKPEVDAVRQLGLDERKARRGES